MKNPFNHENYPSNRIKRNAFPLSFQYNGTFEYGKIYPVGLIRVPNAGTYKIEPTLALNFMPTVFPVQTRQKAYLHFFYGRDRNFWNEYKDFVHGLKPNLVKPYIDEGVTQARTGNLLDYLGVPTTIVGDYGNVSETFEFAYNDENLQFGLDGLFNQQNPANPDELEVQTIESLYEPLYSSIDSVLNIGRIATFDSRDLCLVPLDGYVSKNDINIIDFSLKKNSNATLKDISTLASESTSGNTGGASFVSPIPREETGIFNFIKLILLDSDDKLIDILDGQLFSSEIVRFRLQNTAFSKAYIVYPYELKYYYAVGNSGSFSNLVTVVDTLYSSYTKVLSISKVASEVRDIDFETSPYWRSNDTRGKDTIKLNAIPCRMYETIYNLYYRNPQNNPYMLNGVPEYNIFTPTLDGGVDNNLYQLRYRNWADDFLTTATQTPQQGIAPLVGLTDRGATITLTNEDGSITRYKTTLDDDGNLTGIETTDSSEPILTQALVDAVTYGISIEDIRNVNKMQKWLELNLRKGYQYKDVIEARWGISISYNELNLPEFIGGFTQEVSMQAVTQTANIDDTVTGQLGWQAGRMYCAKDGREITHYCDEAGYIMVLLSVAPMPNYSQLLPKHWFTRDLLEEYQPEFNHIGFQPITYKEVCPVQAYQESTENNNVLEQTFGYQRPWYEYMSMPDEVHGQFRTTLKDYLINRVFDVKPELSESFLLVDPEQINDVFNVTDSDDKILGAINYNIVAKLPISEYATATIE